VRKLALAHAAGALVGAIAQGANKVLEATGADTRVVPGSERDTVRELEILRAAEPAIFQKVFDRAPRSRAGMRERIKELQGKVLENVRYGPARKARAEERRKAKAAKRLAQRAG
jgi:predicted metal-dependent phosphoesterase TrpH